MLVPKLMQLVSNWNYMAKNPMYLAFIRSLPCVCMRSKLNDDICIEVLDNKVCTLKGPVKEKDTFLYIYI